MRRFGRVVAVFAFGAALLPSGCASQTGSGSPPAGGAPVNLATSTLPPPTLMAIASSTLGTVIIDHSGYVVYRYDRDSADPPTSRCLGSCAAQWLPVPAQEQIRLEGIDRQLVGSLRRPDGTLQLTLAGWPLYGYADDRMPGDANGHGLLEAWFAIRPDGSRAGPVRPSP